MTYLVAIRQAMHSQFSNVSEIGNAVFRGEKLHNNVCYAVAYVDLADEVVTRANGLQKFQENLIGEEFFRAPERLRWNNYLYVLAGENSLHLPGFSDAKSRIEADKDYARKRVVTAAELLELLSESKLFDSHTSISSEEITSTWSRMLTDAGLDALLDEPTPRTAVLERIAKGVASRPLAAKKLKSLDARDVELAGSHLLKITITKFRPVHDGATYEFGSVNLIVGSNGTGKTSLLEAIERLYCGHNRRSGSYESALIKGELKGEKTEPTTFLSTTDSQRIKARSLAWYGHSEQQSKSIVTAFSRYNFLDTDAAFRLSTDEKSNDITADLSRLLIGSDATSLWEYLKKTVEALASEQKKSEYELESIRERTVLLEAEIARLKEQPSHAKSINQTFVALLDKVGYIGPRMERNGGLIQVDRELFERTLQGVARISNLSKERYTSPSSVQRRLADVSIAADLVEPLNEETHKAQQHYNELIELRTSLSMDIDTLGNWLRYCSAQFPKIVRIHAWARSEMEDRRGKFGRIRGITLPTVPPEIMDMPLSGAIVVQKAKVVNAESKLMGLKERLRDYTITERAIAQAMAQLRAAAFELIRTVAKDICPVCKTEHQPGELESKIEGLGTLIAASDNLNETQQEIAALEAKLTEAKRKFRILEELDDVIQSLGLSGDKEIAVLIDEMRTLKKKLDSVEDEFSSTERVLSVLSGEGYTEAQMDNLRNLVKPMFSNEEVCENPSEILSLRDKLQERKDQTQDLLYKIQSKLEQNARQINDVVSKLRSMGEETDYQNGGGAMLSLFIAEVRQAAQIVEDLSKLFLLGDEAEFSELAKVTTDLLTFLDQTDIAMRHESSVNEILPKKLAEFERFKDHYAQLERSNQNQRRALHDIYELFSNASLDGATSHALASIKAQVNDVFARIHTPNEYIYDAENGGLLKTKGGKISRSLDEVSTGQRAAFALSIFLALNLTARAAPPLVLVDDPIAHIDDLNALSFLDYLRDLALNSKKQIFFATADTRIANLFEKKFGFLGPENYRRIELTR